MFAFQDAQNTEPSVCCLFILPVSNSFSVLFSDAADVSIGTEYLDDFEEVELEEDDEGEAASTHGAAARQLSDDVAEEEFQLCDAGGLTVTHKAPRENS